MTATGVVWDPIFLDHVTDEGHPDHPRRLLPLYDRLQDPAVKRRFFTITPPMATGEEIPEPPAVDGIGSGGVKYEAVELALGDRGFIDDLRVPGMLHGALRLADHPGAPLAGERTRELVSRRIAVGPRTRAVGILLSVHDPREAAAPRVLFEDEQHESQEDPGEQVGPVLPVGAQAEQQQGDTQFGDRLDIVLRADHLQVAKHHPGEQVTHQRALP